MNEVNKYPNIFFCPTGKDVDTSTIDLDLDGEKETFFEENKNIFESLESPVQDIDYGNLSFWGTSESSGNLWKSMKNDDLIFFSGYDGEIIYMAKIWFKVNKRHGGLISKRFWDGDSQKWCLVYFLKDVRRVSISKKEINRLAGYKEANFFRGLLKMKDDRVFEFFEKFALYYLYHQVEFKRLEEE